MLRNEILDPKIKPFVENLNELGYRTLSSCAGRHNSSNKRGYITLIGYLEDDDIVIALERMGLKRVKIKYSNVFHSVSMGHVKCTIVEFTGLGGESAAYVVKRLQI